MRDRGALALATSGSGVQSLEISDIERMLPVVTKEMISGLGVLGGTDSSGKGCHLGRDARDSNTCLTIHFELYSGTHTQPNNIPSRAIHYHRYDTNIQQTFVVINQQYCERL